MARTKVGNKDPGEAPASIATRRRLALLDAAYEVIAEKGLEGLRTRDIAARAGVNIATLHYYFATKEALLVAVVEFVPQKFLAPPPPRTARAPAPRSRLEEHLDEVQRIFDANPHLNTVLQELTVRAHRDPAARAAFRAVHKRWNAVVEALLLEESRSGALDPSVDPARAARIVTSFVMGSMLQLGVNPRAFAYQELADELAGWVAPRDGRRRRGPRVR